MYKGTKFNALIIMFSTYLPFKLDEIICIDCLIIKSFQFDHIVLDVFIGIGTATAPVVPVPVPNCRTAAGGSKLNYDT